MQCSQRRLAEPRLERVQAIEQGPILGPRFGAIARLAARQQQSLGTKDQFGVDLEVIEHLVAQVGAEAVGDRAQRQPGFTSRKRAGFNVGEDLFVDAIVGQDPVARRSLADRQHREQRQRNDRERYHHQQ